jgi:hypothetical protein
MRQRILVALLCLGTLAGYGSGIASVIAHHHHHHACGVAPREPSPE